MFKSFDPTAEVAISRAQLPHWEQAGATYFITFRTADSLPKLVLAEWAVERDIWLRQHGIDASAEDWQSLLEMLPEVARHEFARQFSQKWHDELDRCHGRCVLRQPELAQIVADSLRHFDGTRYELGDFVVMPNHAHLLVGIAGRDALRQQCRSWKKFTATAINQRLGLTGEFWQVESFDHLVRNAAAFEKLREYVAENPAKAHLREGEYILSSRTK